MISSLSGFGKAKQNHFLDSARSVTAAATTSPVTSLRSDQVTVVPVEALLSAPRKLHLPLIKGLLKTEQN